MYGTCRKYKGPAMDLVARRLALQKFRYRHAIRAEAQLYRRGCSKLMNCAYMLDTQSFELSGTISVPINSIIKAAV